MNLFKKIFKYLSTRGMSDVEKAAKLVIIAVPIVDMVARLTPTRSDEELVALFQTYAVQGVEAWLALPTKDRGRALMTVAAAALKRLTPRTLDRIIDLAIQLAVLEVKGK